jgi:hypothetical protein
MPAMEVQLAQDGCLKNIAVNYNWNVGAPTTDKWERLLPLALDNVIATVKIICGQITVKICTRFSTHTLPNLRNSYFSEIKFFTCKI